MTLDTTQNTLLNIRVPAKNWRQDKRNSAPFTAAQKNETATVATLDAALLASGNPAYNTQAKLDALTPNDKVLAYREIKGLV